MKKVSKKLVKKIGAKVEKKETKKQVKKLVKVSKISKPVATKPSKPSISKMVFAFITNKKVLDSDNKKAFFIELQDSILKAFPKSAFKESHFYWYIAKYKLQKKYGLELTHLQTSKLNQLINK